MKAAITIITVTSVVSILLYPFPAHPSEVTEQVKSTIEEVVKILKDPSLQGPEKAPARRTRLQTAIAELFDFEEMAKRSLARHWSKRSDKEKGEFVALFRKLIEKSYIEKIERYTDEEILYVGERRKDGRALVKTKIVTKQGTEIPIHYRLLNEQERGWMVYDIVVEGVSLVSNYRSQFNRIIRSSSYRKLIKRLQSKVE